jgi:hypothetical protein
MARTPVETSELITWMEDDWLGLWELADQGGLGHGVPIESVLEYVINTVEPGLRQGLIRLGRVHTANSPEHFDPIELPIDDLLDLIRDGIRQTGPNASDPDLWFDTVPRED